MCKSGKSEKILNFLPTEGMGCLFRVYTNMGRLSSVRLSLCVFCLCYKSSFACVYVFVCFLGGCVQISPSVGCFVLVPSKVSFP